MVRRQRTRNGDYSPPGLASLVCRTRLFVGLMRLGRTVSPRSFLGQKKLLRQVKVVGYWHRKEWKSAPFWQMLPLEINFPRLRDRFPRIVQCFLASATYTLHVKFWKNSLREIIYKAYNFWVLIKILTERRGFVKRGGSAHAFGLFSPQVASCRESFTSTVVPPHPWGICSGCPNPWRGLTFVYTVVFPIHRPKIKLNL